MERYQESIDVMEVHLQQSRASEQFGPTHVHTLHSNHTYGNALIGIGRYDEAAAVHAENVRQRKALLQEEQEAWNSGDYDPDYPPSDSCPDVLASLCSHAEALNDGRRPAEAEVVYREELAMCISYHGESNRNTIQSLRNLANCLSSADIDDVCEADDVGPKLSEGCELLRRAAELGAGRVREDGAHARTADEEDVQHSRIKLADALCGLRGEGDAEIMQILRDVHSVASEGWRHAHVDRPAWFDTWIDSLSEMSDVLMWEGRTDEAEAMRRQQVAQLENIPAGCFGSVEESRPLMVAKRGLADLLVIRGVSIGGEHGRSKLREAEALFREVLAAQATDASDDNLAKCEWEIEAVGTRTNLAEVLVFLGKTAAANEQVAEAVRVHREHEAPRGYLRSLNVSYGGKLPGSRVLCAVQKMVAIACEEVAAGEPVSGTAAWRDLERQVEQMQTLWYPREKHYLAKWGRDLLARVDEGRLLSLAEERSGRRADE